MWSRVGPTFGPRGIIWKNLVDSTGWLYIPNIKNLGHMVSDKKIFFMLSLYKPMFKTCDPGVGILLAPGA